MSAPAPSESQYAAMAAASWKATPELNFAGRRLVKVVDVYDGDTCTAAFWFGGALVRTQLRLHGFDSPELRANRGTPLESGEKERALICRDALRALLLNRIVAVHFAQSDKYGRALARIYADVPRRATDEVAALVARCGGASEPRGGAAARVISWLKNRGAASDADPVQHRDVLASRATTAVARDLPASAAVEKDSRLCDVNEWMLLHTCSVPYGADMPEVHFSGAADAPVAAAAYAELRAATRESTVPFELVGRTYAKIIKVYDGDTCTAAFSFDGRLVRVNVRTHGYDSPEMRAGRGRQLKSGEKEKAHACRDALRALVLNRIIAVEFLPNPGHHNYGRALGRLYVRRGARRPKGKGAEPLIHGGAGAGAAAAAPATDDLPQNAGPLTDRKLHSLLDVNAWMLENTESVAYVL